jgi:CheY-like chemotaxis protein
LKVSSEAGVGTVFTVYFPISKSSESWEPPRPVVSRTGRPLSGVVLVADDDHVVRKVTGQLLRFNGFTVLEAGDGEEAVAAFTSSAPDIAVVLLDYAMPRRNGREVFLAIRQIREDVPVIFMSGYDERTALADLWEASDVYFVQKPFRGQQLLSEIQRAFEGSGRLSGRAELNSGIADPGSETALTAE